MARSMPSTKAVGMCIQCKQACGARTAKSGRQLRPKSPRNTMFAPRITIDNSPSPARCLWPLPRSHRPLFPATLTLRTSCEKVVMTHPHSFGSWLKQQRRLLDLTQQELADRVGCAVGTIRKIEADERRPSKVLGERLADALAIEPAARAQFFHLARLAPGFEHLAPPSLPPHLPIPLPPAPAPPSSLRQSDAIPILPVPPTPLVGREEEVRVVRQRLLRDAVRLLTLTGPPGIGKTRLALEVAHQVIDDFEDGVLFVPLASLQSTEQVISAIAQALQVRSGAHGSALAILQATVRARHLLLVLDTFEHVTAAAPLLTELLAAAPRLKLLVTSREVLHLSGEHELPIAPLAVPPPRLPATDPAQALLTVPSVALFVQQAQAVCPDFKLTTENATAVAQLCTRLDGLPLALELAAARAKLFAPQAILARLAPLTRTTGRATALSWLTKSARDLPPRQQTLHAAIRWSFDLLDQPEQNLFVRLAPFQGSCDAAAVAAICMPPATDPAEALDLLASLLDKSLLHHVSSPDGEPRFTMLAIIREFAMELLAARGEDERVAQAHATYYLALAEQCSALLHSAQRPAVLRQLDAEIGNLRAALAWFHTAPDGAPHQMRLAHALSLYWETRGLVSEGRAAAEQALDRGDTGDLNLRCELLNQAGWKAQLQGDYAAAIPRHEAALALAQEMDNPRYIAGALNFLGTAAGRQGDYPRADALLSESLARYRTMATPPTAAIATLLNNLAIVVRHLGDLPRCRRLLDESLALKRESGNGWSIASVLSNLADLALQQGDRASAARYCHEALALRQQLGDQIGTATSLEQRARLATLDGDHERAVRLFAAAAALREQIETPTTEAQRTDAESHITTLRAAIPPPRFAAAWADGHALTVAEALAEALR